MREEVRRGWWDGSLVDTLENVLQELPDLVSTRMA